MRSTIYLMLMLAGFIPDAACFAQMAANKTITQNITASKDYGVMAANIKAAGLAENLSGRGPFTVFAPSDNAFEKSPKVAIAPAAGSVDKASLQALMTYHIVAGKMDSKAIAAAIKAGNGKTVLTTLQGGKLTVSMEGAKMVITDEKGNRAVVVTPDIDQSNGVVHLIDRVLMHK